MPARSIPAWIRAALLLSTVLSLVSMVGVGWILAETGRLEEEIGALSKGRPRGPRPGMQPRTPGAATSVPGSPTDAATDLPSALTSLRADVQSQAEAERGADESLAALKGRVETVAQASGKTGQEKMIDSLMEMAMKQEVGKLKGRLKLRPDQIQAVSKIYEETFEKFKGVFAEFLEGDEEVVENEKKYEGEFEQEQKTIFDRIVPLLDHAQLVEFDKFRQEKEKEREIRVEAGSRSESK